MSPAFVAPVLPFSSSPRRPHLRLRHTQVCSQSLRPPTSSPTSSPTPSPSDSDDRRSAPTDVLSTLSHLTARVQTIKCPFWRRRFGDVLETTSQILQWAVRTRHKSLPLPPLLLPRTAPSPARFVVHAAKQPHLPLLHRLHLIRDDFLVRQYYVTGRLSAALYEDYCLFDGPDPDGRVRGLHKFVDAAAGLFDSRLSRVDLIDIYVIDGPDHPSPRIVAEWRLQGALKLPWRPQIKPYVGSTTYSFSDNLLVSEHVETWSISVIDAFVSVVWPHFGQPPAPHVDTLRARKRRKGTLRWLRHEE